MSEPAKRTYFNANITGSYRLCIWLFSLQVTEALDNEELKPPSIPYELLQQLCQAPVLISALQAAPPFLDTALGGRDKLDSMADVRHQSLNGGVYWTARLSVSPAAVESSQHDGASSSSSPDPPGKERVVSKHMASV